MYIQKKILTVLWSLIAVLLLLYSFTQIDLGLTITRSPFLFSLQRFFQNIGYFNRPLSAYLFILIIVVSTMMYLFTLWTVKKGIIKRKDIWIIIFIVGGILFFSYNALSYDLFNYIFDAKIVTFYHQNPYEHKALDYPSEPMLGFMHWTHRTYPYGPVWLGLTIPLSYFGMGHLLLTIYLFRFLMFGSFIGTAYFIERILLATKPKFSNSGLAFFALSPFVLIESVVNAHNDIVMLFGGVLSLYLILIGKKVPSIILYILSVGIKYATIFLLPTDLLYITKKKKFQENYNFLFLLTILIMFIPIILASIRTNFQPWYLLYYLPFAALVSDKYYVVIPSIVLSIFALFQYVPFLYLGNWDPPVPGILSGLLISSIVISVIMIMIFYVKNNKVFGFKKKSM